MPKADKYSAGGIYLGSAPAIRIDAKCFYLTIEKIIRGLHRLCAGSPMPIDAKFRWFIQEPMHGLRKRFFIDARVSLGYPEVFESRFVLVKADDVLWRDAARVRLLCAPPLTNFLLVHPDRRRQGQECEKGRRTPYAGKGETVVVYVPI